MFSCTVCKKTFTLNYNLLRHLSEHKDNAKFECDICEYVSPRSDNLKRHKKLKHPEVRPESSNVIPCVLCKEFSCLSRSEMLKHYKLQHEIVFAEKECFTFDSKEQFEAWMEATEKRDRNHFVRNTGSKKCADGRMKSCFDCFRDGMFDSKGEGLRYEKILGSNKINGYCPSKIEVTTYPSGKIEVEYFKTHVGHKNELGRMRMSNRERDEIAQKITLKIPLDEILDSVRTSVSSDIERRDLLTTKDLRNLAQTYLIKDVGIRDENDSTSVHAWVEEMRAAGKGSSIAFYKPQGSLSEEFPELKEEDFVLITMNDTQKEILEQSGKKVTCMDSTHGLNAYKFDLTTLLVLDDLNEGFPCTFMFSNRTDCEMLKVMLLNVKRVLGKSVETDVFMTDMAEEFYNA